MKKTYIILLMLFFLNAFVYDASAQFVVAQDTIRGRIDFSPRLGDLNNTTIVPNDSVFYMFPPVPEADPWRYVDYYLPSRETKRGYIQGTKLMRVDDYDIVEVERLSSHGTISFKNDKVRVHIAVVNVTSRDTSIKLGNNGGYTVDGKPAKGTAKWAAPKLRYQSISVMIKGKNIIFPKKVYEHLFEPEIDNMVVYYNEQKDIVYIVANNGRSNYYQAMWQVSSRGVADVYIFDPSTK